jgi:hypothetical protein
MPPTNTTQTISRILAAAVVRTSMRFTWRAAAPMAVLALVLCTIPIRVGATTWPAPVTPLTDDDKMDFAVSGGHLPVLVSVEAIRDSADADGVLIHWMSVQPLRWYRGNRGHLPVRIVFPPVAQGLFAELASWMEEGAVTAVMFPYERDGQLFASAGPSLPGGGMLRPEGRGLPELEAEVGRGIERTTPEGLERRSDLVLVGHVLDSDHTCEFQGRQIGCTRVAVDSVVAGTAPSDTIDVFDDYGPLLRRGSKLLTLRRAGRAFRVVGAGNGMSPILGQRVLWHETSVDDMSRRIRASRSRRTGGVR